MEKSKLRKISRHEDFTFYQRGKIWYYKCYDRDGNLSCGHSTGCKSRTAAQKYCEKLRREGVIYSQSNRTFKAYAAHFFDNDGSYVRYAKVSGRAYNANYLTKLRSVTKNYLIPTFGEMLLEGITSDDIKAALFKFKENGLSNKSVNHILSVLRIILNDVLNNGMMYISPLHGVRPFAEERKPRKPFELSETMRILHENFKSEKIRSFVLTAVLMGMRAGEIMAIRRETLHPTYIEVKDQIQNRTLCPTKTKQSRIVPIISELYELLHALAEKDFPLTEFSRASLPMSCGKSSFRLCPKSGRQTAIAYTRSGISATRGCFRKISRL